MATKEAFTRFKEQKEIIAEQLSDNDIFPGQFNEVKDGETETKDFALPYGQMKNKATKDVLSNSSVIRNIPESSFATLGEKFIEVDSIKSDLEAYRIAYQAHRFREMVGVTRLGYRQLIIDEKGNEDVMYVIPKFNCEDLDPEGKLGTGPHPAFLVNGVEIPYFAIGCYQASNTSGIPVSQYNKSPWVNIDFDTARAKCLQKGNGYHLITNFEWAAIAYWTLFAKGIEPAGNVSSSAAIGTGTGGATYAHNRKNNGIFDLVGNVWEWTDGIKQDENNHILLCETNDISKMTNSEDESTWLDCGERPNFSSGSVMWRDAYKNIGNDKDEEVRLLFKRGLVRPIGEHQFNGNGWSSAGERVLLRGGGWNAGASAGLGAFTLDTARSITYSTVGFRFAFLP